MFAAEFRTIDGTGNNLANPEWGSTGEQLLRTAPAEYADGISAPVGADRPGAREISNAIVAHSDEATPNDRNLTAFIYIWGQFIDHDLDLTGAASPREAINVPVPTGDPVFDPDSTGSQLLPVNRSIYDPTTGTSVDNPRQQINQITAWLDGSMVYGSDAATSASLRAFVGGKLKTISGATGDLPPVNASGSYLAGDVRANENIELTSMHTLFVREHNRLAGEIAAANPLLSDEEIYQRARALVIAELQVITYKEWLPALLGPGALSRYQGYDAAVNPGIANEFSASVFRLHSTINDDVEFFDNDGRAITFEYLDEDGETITVEGEVALFEAFFNPTLFKYSGVDGILKYAASTHMEEIDNQIVDSLRDFLVTLPAGGLDLASLNIQRGRDHGLADYNEVRVAYGLPAVDSFDDITTDQEVQQTLEELYGDVDNIDLWVGAMAEDHLRGSSAGPLMRAVIAEQFERLRDGDRFWYQRQFSGRELARLERTTLADVIERNTGVDGLQENVFFFRAQVSGQVFLDRNGDGDQDRREAGLARVTVELLNDEGEVVATTLTGRDGSYRFEGFHETGDFQVRAIALSGMVVTSENPQELLISAGDVRVRGLDFGLRPGGQPSPTASQVAAAPTTGSATMAAALVDDAFEENDTFATASNLGTLNGLQSFAQLVQADGNDWYRFSISSPGRSGDNVAIAFQHAQGDLDLQLYRASGQRIRSSTSVSNVERVSLNGLAAGTYYARVYGYRGATNPAYSLTVNVSASSPADPGTPTTQPPTTQPPTTQPPSSPGAFDIQFVFSGLSASQQSIFDQAAAKWESIIVGDLPNATYGGQVVDDLVIVASAVTIDGRGNVLGQAGPDRLRSGSLLPYHGVMQFDTADMAAMEANATLLGVILHEMGHVLGVGTLWSSKGLLSGASSSNPRFTGPQATAAYNAIFGTNATGVPVESSGGSGTRDAHWSESVFRSELMTGYIGPGTSLPLSRITVASLADLGYSVNIAAADNYAPPQS